MAASRGASMPLGSTSLIPLRSLRLHHLVHDAVVMSIPQKQIAPQYANLIVKFNTIVETIVPPGL